MTTDEASHEDVRFLTGSPQRPEILRALCDDAYRPTELTDEVDVTRTTVQRILSGFRERHWVRKRDGLYRATVTGHRIHERYATLRTELERAREFGPLAGYLGDLAADLPESALADAEVTVASDREPLAAVDRLLRWFDETDAERVRTLSPIVARTFNQAAENLIERGVRVDLVIDQETLERSVAQFRDATERGVEAERANVYVTPEPLQFGVVVGERTGCLGIYDDDNNLRGVLVSGDDSFVEWALATYEGRREGATPLDRVLGGLE